MRLVLVAALLAFAAFAAFVALGACGPRTEGLDTSKLPPELRADYDVFARRCSKCHSLARPLQSGIADDEQWVLYVKRMRRQPASGISPDDETVILRFLRYYAAEERKKKAEASGGAPASGSPDASASAISPASPTSRASPAPSGSSASPAALPEGGTR